MSYTATVLRVMIASPSDVPDERNAVERAVHGWNDANSRNKGVILQPWRWETSAIPILGAHPQKLINAQGVDDSDIVFALFGGRLGSPTPDAVSGTIEEVDRAQELGRPVHMYFSTAPLPNTVDTAQLDALRAFRSDMQERGLLGEFNNTDQLTHEVWKAIEHDIAALELDQALTMKSRVNEAEFLVQPHQEREISGMSQKGAPRYKTKHWLDITNTGTCDAQTVSFESVGDDSAMLIAGVTGPTTIHRGQTRRLPIMFTFGGAGSPVLRIRWIEGEEERFQDFHVG